MSRTRYADAPRDRQAEHAAHMERVNAVMRRGQYERVLAKIAFYEACARQDPPLLEHEQDQLKYLRELRDALRREMIEAGQIAADA